jgi:hypothetical protein
MMALTLGEIKTRNKYLLTIRSVFERTVYEQRDLAKAERIEEAIAKNTRLLGDVSPTFIYKGVIYQAWYYGRQKGFAWNRQIHPDALADVIFAIDNQDFDVLIEEKKVMNYISNALGISQHVNDLFCLIPDRIHSPIRSINTQYFTIGEPMTEDQLSQFKEDNRSGLIAFKRLFLERLIMS